MLFKILFGLLVLILFEVIDLFKQGVMDHKLAFGILKILLLNIAFASILALKSFYLNLFLKIKDAIPPLIKTAAKIFETPLKTPRDKTK